MSYCVYILSSKRNGTLYIGVTNDLARRIYEHKSHIVEGFTKQYDVTLLMYFESFVTAHEAIEREKCIKRWKRFWKTNLIEENNPEWNDLSDLMETGE